MSTTIKPMDPTLLDLLADKIAARSADACWQWLAGINNSGTPVLGVGTGIVNARRAMWELHVGPLEANQKVCHRGPADAGVKVCVNPGHMAVVDEPLTKRVSDQRILRGVARVRERSGTCTFRALAGEVGLSRSACVKRVARLVEQGKLVQSAEVGSIRLPPKTSVEEGRPAS